MNPRTPIQPGERFGKLTVIGVAPRATDGEPLLEWECRCDCGQTTRASAHYLVRGRKKSCGCAHYGHQRKHGEAIENTVEYRTWSSMKSRCIHEGHPRYDLYGGRGIRVAPEWVASFESFLKHVGRRPGPRYSLDRIDNDGHYEPGNVRWATSAQQGNNRRTNRFVTVNGVTRTVSEWSKATGLSYRAITARLNRGWPAELAVSAPADHKRALFPRKSRSLGGGQSNG